MTDLLHSLADFGQSLRDWCIATTISTALLLIVALIVDRLLSQRVAAAWRILLFIPVLLRILIPLDLNWAVPFWTMSTPQDSIARQVSAFASASAPSVQSVPAASISMWTAVFPVLYLIGVVSLLICWYRDRCTLTRLVKHSRPHESSNELLISTSAGPIVAGVMQPRIIIPAWLIASDALPLILAHERAHIARRDPVTAAVLRLFCTFAWPVLPAWIATSRIRALIEHACDDLALGPPASRHQESIMKYAQTLIEVADRSTHLPRSLAFGASLHSRIASLRPAHRWPRTLQVLLAGCVCSVLVACSVARPGASQSSESPARAMDQNPPEPAPAPSGPTTFDLRQTTPVPRASNLVDSRSAERRIINVRIISGHAPVAGLYSDPAAPKVVTTSTEQLSGSLMQLTDATTLAAPRLLVHVDQPAAVEVGNDQQKFSVQLQVHPSAPGTVSATLNYLEGDAYVIRNTQLQFKKGECAVVSVPSISPGKPPRTLIITIDRPGEEVPFGC